MSLVLRDASSYISCFLFLRNEIKYWNLQSIFPKDFKFRKISKFEKNPKSKKCLPLILDEPACFLNLSNLEFWKNTLSIFPKNFKFWKISKFEKIQSPKSAYP